MKHRVIMFPLVLTMLLLLFPVFASANSFVAQYTTADGTTVQTDTLIDALTKVADDGTVTLLNDATLESISITDKSITLLGGGYTVTCTGAGFTLNGTASLSLGAPDVTDTLTIKSTSNTNSIINVLGHATLFLHPHVTLGPSSAGGQAAGVQLGDSAQFTMYGGTIQDCVNWASISGAISITDNSKFYFKDGLIENCSGVEGGAISLHPGPAIGPESSGKAALYMVGGTIRNCTDSNLGGGAICAETGSQPFILEITGGTIEQCTADGTQAYGGAIYLDTNNSMATSISISNLILKENHADDLGGAIYVDVPSSVEVPLTNVRIEGGSATDGGGLYLKQGKLTASQLTVSGNKATGNGGGVYLAGGSATFAADTRITENQAENRGGGLYRAVGTLNGLKGTITGNSAKAGGGLAIENSSGYIVLSNALTVFDNRAAEAGDDLTFSGSGMLFLPGLPTAELTACGHGIDGWYKDAADARWGTGSCGQEGGGVERCNNSMPLTSPLAVKAAHGEIQKYEISVTVIGSGTVTPAGPTVMVEEGASKTFTFVPGEDQRIADVTVDGESKGAISKFTFSSVNGPHALVVTFAPSHHTLTFHTNGGTEVPQEKHPYNTTVPLTHETTRDNHSFTGWYADPELTERITEITLLQDAHVYAGWRYEAKPQPPKPTDPSDTPTLTTDDHFSYIAGYPDGTVRPEAEISRAEVATIFFRLLSPASRAQFWSEEANFSDVDDNAWYFNAVATMANAGVLEGYPDGTFRPNGAITRGEFAAISARFLSEPYSGPNLFSDIDGHWAATYINQAAEAGWIHGYGDDTFRPEQPISRAEAMTLINAMLGRKPHRDFLLSDARPWPDNAPDAWYYAQVQEATYSHTYQFPDGQAFEHWVELLENPDWAALEAQWRLDYARP